MNLSWKSVWFVVLTCIALSGCQSVGDSMAEVDVQCQSPRPEVCTREYRPVCGLLEGGGQPVWRTQGNACSACANPSVVGYKASACE